MQRKIADVTAAEWAQRKMYSEEFFHACLVDEEAAILVQAAETVATSTSPSPPSCGTR